MIESKKQEGFLKEHAALLVKEITGKKRVEVKHINRGVMTLKFAVQLHTGERYIVRFYPLNRSDVVAYEPDVLHQCLNKGLPVPEVIADSRTGPSAPQQYLIYKMIDGVPLSDRFPRLSDTSRMAIAAQLVNYLFTFQELQVSGYGDLIDISRARYNSWQEFIRRSFRDGINAAKRYALFPASVIKELEAVVRNLKVFQRREKSSLAWGDISLENILVDDSNRIAALIDFEGTLAADILLNLGYCYAMYQDTGFFKSIEQAWPDVLTDDQWRKIEFYAILRAIRIAKYASQPLPTGHPRTPMDQLLPGFISALSIFREQKITK